MDNFEEPFHIDKRPENLDNGINESFSLAVDLSLTESEMLDFKTVLMDIRREFFLEEEEEEGMMAFEGKMIDQVLDEIEVISDSDDEDDKKKDIIKKKKILSDENCFKIAIIFNQTLKKLDQVKETKPKITARLLERGFKEDQIEVAIEKAEKYISQIYRLQIRMIEHKTEKPINILRKKKIEELLIQGKDWEAVERIINTIQELENKKQKFKPLSNQLKELENDLKEVKKLKQQERVSVEFDSELARLIEEKENEIDKKKREIEISKEIVENFLTSKRYQCFSDNRKAQELCSSEIVATSGTIDNLKQKIKKKEKQIDQMIFNDLFKQDNKITEG